MTTDELQRGTILHFAIDGGDDLECAVVSGDSEIVDDAEELECVEVCFLDAGEGYSRGEVGMVSLDSFREFAKESN